MVQNWIQSVKYNWILSDIQLYIYQLITSCIYMDIYIYIYIFFGESVYMDIFKDIQQDTSYNSYLYNLNTIDNHFYILLTI